MLCVFIAGGAAENASKKGGISRDVLPYNPRIEPFSGPGNEAELKSRRISESPAETAVQGIGDMAGLFDRNS
jgi:hypothetical protein